jgi:RNA polymerase sigma-70 factor (ECF subfamily)
VELAVKRQQPVSPPTEADRALARRCAREPEAREELFRRHAPAVYRLARRIVGNAADAEDVLQEVFVDALASIAGYRGEAPIAGWLARIAVRRAMRHRRRLSVPRLELCADGEPSVPDAAAAVDSRATLRRVSALLERLSDDRRVIFILHQVESYSLPEAAALLGISVTAAKKRVWRARRELERLARGDPALAPLLGAEGGDV